jgi:hypothetical protein
MILQLYHIFDDILRGITPFVKVVDAIVCTNSSDKS